MRQGGLGVQATWEQTWSGHRPAQTAFRMIPSSLGCSTDMGQRSRCSWLSELSVYRERALML